MNECNFIEATNTYSDLSDQTKFRLDEINKIKDYFNPEIQERNIMSKKLSSNKWRNKYYLFYKGYWGFCRNSKCKF